MGVEELSTGAELSTAGINWMSTGAGSCCCLSRCSQLNASFMGGPVSRNLKELRVGGGEASENVKEPEGFLLLLSRGLERVSSEKDFLDSDGLPLLLSTLLPLPFPDFVLKKLRPVRMLGEEKLILVANLEEVGEEELLLLLVPASKIDSGDLISSFRIFGQDSFVSTGSLRGSHVFLIPNESGRLRFELNMFRFFQSARSLKID